MSKRCNAPTVRQMAARLPGRCERRRSQIAKTEGSFEVELVFRGVSPNGWEICSPIQVGMVNSTRLEKRTNRQFSRVERLRRTLEKVQSWCDFSDGDEGNRQKSLALREGLTAARISQLMQLREIRPDLRQRLLTASHDVLEKLSVRKLMNISRQPFDTQVAALGGLGVVAE